MACRSWSADEWMIAPPLAAAGADLDWCERAAEALDGPGLQAGLEWVASTLSAAALLSEIKESSGRIYGLVDAVRPHHRWTARRRSIST